MSTFTSADSSRLSNYKDTGHVSDCMYSSIHSFIHSQIFVWCGNHKQKYTTYLLILTINLCINKQKQRVIVRPFISYSVGCIPLAISFHVLVKPRDIPYSILGPSVIECDGWLIKYKAVVMVVHA